MSDTVCYTKLPPPDQRTKANALAIKENPHNGFCKVSSKTPHESKDMAVFVHKIWQSGRELDVSFLGDNWTVPMMHRVEKHANTWTAFANLRFHYTVAKESDIRIELGVDGKDWSAIGTDSQLVEDWGKPTMHLGSISESTEEDTLKYVVTHQFGHALGCMHEFQSPTSKILWDEDTVYDDLKKKGYSPSEISENILTQYPKPGTKTTDFDIDSIMMMAIPKSWTRNGFSAAQPKELSDNDMISIREMYNGDLARRPGQGLKLYSTDITRLNTLDDPYSGDGSLRSATLTLGCEEKNYSGPPKIAVGLNELDFDCDHNMRIRATGWGSSDASTYTISMNTWSASKWYSGACSWLKFDPRDPVFRTGTVSWDANLSNTQSERVYFDRSFDRPPKVIVWINSLDMNSDHNYRVKTWVSSVDASGCTVNIQTWSTTEMYECSVTWVAIRADTAGIAGGYYATCNDWHHPERQYTGTVTLDHSAFPLEPPRSVLLGFNELDLMSQPCNSRVNTHWGGLTNRQFNWTIETWSDSVLYAAGVSYIVS